jgi:hypothetical protein
MYITIPTGKEYNIMGIPLAALAINQNQPGPLDQAAKALQLKSLAQQQQYQAQAQPLELQQRQQAIEQEKRRIANLDASTKAMNQWNTGDLADLPDLIRKNGGDYETVMQAHKAVYAQKEQISKIAEQDATTGSKNIETYQKKADQTVGELSSAKDIPDEQLSGWALGKVGELAQSGIIDPSHAQHLAQQIQQSQTPAQIREGLDHYSKGIQGASALATQAQKEQERKTAEATQKHLEMETAAGPKITEPELAAKAVSGGPEAAQAEATLKRLDQSKRESRPVNINNLATPGDVQDAADAIESGDQAPTLQGLYRNTLAVKAELARRGVPLAKMELDWKATQKYVSSLNSTQQLRLQQSISSASELLPKIDTLYAEWKQLAPVSGFKIANHAALIAMKNMPGRAGAVASALDTQITELTADLGNIYMGGNSPTDQALKLGHQALQSDWGPQAFEEGIKQAKLNIGIRQNSMRHGGPAGLSGTTNYAPGVGGGGAAPEAAKSYTPPAGAQTATGPNGHKINVDNGKWVDSQTGQPLQ